MDRVCFIIITVSRRCSNCLDLKMPNKKHQALRKLCDRLAQNDSLLMWGAKFVDLEECSENYKESFKNAWKVSQFIANLIIAVVEFQLLMT